MKKKRLCFMNKKKDFAVLKQKGTKIRGRGFFIVCRKNNLTYSRFGFFFPKWTGNAVQRNRFKRWGRRFLQWEKLPVGVDLLLGLEKREKDFYQRINFESFCLSFKKLFLRIEL